MQVYSDADGSIKYEALIHRFFQDVSTKSTCSFFYSPRKTFPCTFTTCSFTVKIIEHSDLFVNISHAMILTIVDCATDYGLNIVNYKMDQSTLPVSHEIIAIFCSIVTRIRKMIGHFRFAHRRKYQMLFKLLFFRFRARKETRILMSIDADPTSALFFHQPRKNTHLKSYRISLPCFWASMVAIGSWKSFQFVCLVFYFANTKILLALKIKPNLRRWQRKCC